MLMNIKLNDLRKIFAERITGPIVPFLHRLGLTPDLITWIGLVINVIAAATIATNHLLIGGILVLFSGLFDILDGALARFTGKSTRFGALLDSTFDRLSEAFILFGILFLYTFDVHIIEILLIFWVMTGSFLTSYIRARAEGLGMECKSGLFTRAERVIILALGLILNQVLIVLVILAIFVFVTVVQRMVYVWKQTKSNAS